MQLHQLEQFCAVARMEHMSQAARNLHISQPTLSLNITRLEDELGVQLFDRVGRNIKLNKYGRTFLFHVEQVLDGIETAKQAVKRLDEGEDVRIGLADAILNNTYMLLSSYLEENPGVQIMHQSATIPEILSLLRNESIDMAIAVMSNECDFGMDIRWLPVRRTELMLLVPTNHRFAGREAITLHELEDEPLMHAISNFDSRDSFDHYCEQAGFTPCYVYNSIKPFLFNQLTREQGYLSVIPEILWRDRASSSRSAELLARNSASYMDTAGIVGVKIKDPVCYVDYGILTSKKHFLTKRAEDFRSFIQLFLQTRLEEL